MGLTGRHTYVGFGFGPLQAGLFLYEAFRSGNFRRLVVVEVLPTVVDQLRDANGMFRVNLAHADRVESVEVGPVEIFSPSLSEDREQIAAALSDAQEIGTAIPGVDFYSTAGPASLHYIMAGGLIRKVLRCGPPAVVYAAEIHHDAAESLDRVVLQQVPEHFRERVQANVQFLNTVVGKMGGVVTDPASHGLAPVTPDAPRAFLAEALDWALVSKIFLPEFERGIGVFTEKENLLPFEEARLFGHYATHALAGFLGKFAGVRRMTDLRTAPGLMAFLRDAFLLESGESLIRKHKGADDLFTPEGFRSYADDLLQRMTNPFLMDTTDRVCRDPARKLRWEDRLTGTLRLALSQDVEPRRYALGAAAALAVLNPDYLGGKTLAAELLRPIWQPDQPSSAESEAVLDLIKDAAKLLRRWQDAKFPDLGAFFNEWKSKP